MCQKEKSGAVDILCISFTEVTVPRLSVVEVVCAVLPGVIN